MKPVTEKKALALSQLATILHPSAERSVAPVRALERQYKRSFLFEREVDVSVELIFCWTETELDYSQSSFGPLQVFALFNSFRWPMMIRALVRL